MDECPLCGSHVSGDECSCSMETAEKLYFIIVNHIMEEDGSFKDGDYWGMFGTTKTALLRSAAKSLVGPDKYSIFTVPAEIVAANRTLSLLYPVPQRIYYRNIADIDSLNWKDFERSDWEDNG